MGVVCANVWVWVCLCWCMGVSVFVQVCGCGYVCADVWMSAQVYVFAYMQCVG